MKFTEISFLDIDENKEYVDILNKVMKECFIEEKLNTKKLYVNIVLTNPKNIRKINYKYRDIDNETDVLSFPMFEKEELDKRKDLHEDILGDIVISIERVKQQSIEYGHSFERELAYMAVHGFYHLMGYDHIRKEDKVIMRQKEENILQKLKISK